MPRYLLRIMKSGSTMAFLQNLYEGSDFQMAKKLYNTVLQKKEIIKNHPLSRHNEFPFTTYFKEKNGEVRYIQLCI